AILQVHRPLELAVITGRNADARAKLAKLAVPPQHRTHLLGFTDEIDEWMALADLVLSKPGGLTTSETLARGAAMVIINPIPGQETRNSDYLLEYGAAIKVNNLGTLAFKVGELLDDPGRVERLKANALRLGRPRAAYDVVERALQLIKR